MGFPGEGVQPHWQSCWGAPSESLEASQPPHVLGPKPDRGLGEWGSSGTGELQLRKGWRDGSGGEVLCRHEGLGLILSTE